MHAHQNGDSTLSMRHIEIGHGNTAVTVIRPSGPLTTAKDHHPLMIAKSNDLDMTHHASKVEETKDMLCKATTSIILHGRTGTEPNGRVGAEEWLDTFPQARGNSDIRIGKDDTARSPMAPDLELLDIPILLSSSATSIDNVIFIASTKGIMELVELTAEVVGGWHPNGCEVILTTIDKDAPAITTVLLPILFNPCDNTRDDGRG